MATAGTEKEVGKTPAAAAAKAALLQIDLDTGEMYHTIFSEAEDCEDPVASCIAFRESVEADWPNHAFAIAANAPARARATTERVRAMGALEARELCEGCRRLPATHYHAERERHECKHCWVK